MTKLYQPFQKDQVAHLSKVHFTSKIKTMPYLKPVLCSCQETFSDKLYILNQARTSLQTRKLSFNELLVLLFPSASNPSEHRLNPCCVVGLLTATSAPRDHSHNSTILPLKKKIVGVRKD